MNKIFFLFAMLASATVTVTPVSTDYAAQKVTFKVVWTNSPTAPYNNRVWVWIDFCPVTGTTPVNSFSTATISNPAKTGGNGTVTGATARGFFIEYGATNTGTTVTAVLSNASGKFNWCAYGSDYPPNATAANGTYTLKGTPPFIINGTTTLGAGVKTYSGGCITSLTDPTGCPGIINYTAISAGAINSSSTIVNTNVTPAAITSNTAASGSGGFTYRWVRSGTSSATYADNNAGHSFTTAEINTAGTWTYYREVRDNTCATTTWSRSSGSYKLTVIACPYTGSDLYLTSSYPCQQRTSGAENWQAYIRDSRDSKVYRIIQMPNAEWWLADYLDYIQSGITTAVYEGLRYYKTWPTCPSGWTIWSIAKAKSLFTTYGSTNLARIKSTDRWQSSYKGNDYYGLRIYPTHAINKTWTNATNDYDSSIIDNCNENVQGDFMKGIYANAWCDCCDDDGNVLKRTDSPGAPVRCYRTL